MARTRSVTQPTWGSAALALACALAAAPLLPQPTSPPLAVSGVVSQGGGAAPGVEVALRPWPSQYHLGLHELGVADALPETVAEILSDADGRFQLIAPAVGPYRLEFRFAGGAVAMPTFHCPLLPLAAPVVLGEIELPSLYRLTVRAEDSTGSPVPHALVLADATTGRSQPPTMTRGEAPGFWSSDPGSFEPCRPQASRVATRTGEDGLAHLLVPHVRSAVLLSAPGHRPIGRTVDSDEASFRLEPETGVRVRVRAPDGNPAPGVLVCADEPLGLPLGLTDERGEARVHLAGRRNARIEFVSADHAVARAALPQRRAADAGAAPVEVKLEPPARFHGRVVDTDTGQAIPGAVAWPAADPGLGARADQFGALDVSIPPRAGSLGIAAAGHIPATLELGRPETRTSAPVSIGLAPAAPLHGRVVDGLGGAVPGATVKAEPGGGSSLVDQLSAGPVVLSAADGSFWVANAVHGSAYRLTAAAEGYAPAVQQVPAIEHGGAAAPVQLVVTRGRQPWGTIVDSTGAPVEAAQVSLLRAPDFAPIEASALAEPVADPVATSARGEFEFPNVAPGGYGVRVNHLEHVELRWQEVNVPPGEGYADLGVFTLAEGAELHGVVTGANGRVVSGAQVFGTQKMQIISRTDRDAHTDRDGRFRLTGLADVPVDIGVIADGHAPKTVAGVRPGTGEPILIELTAGASIAGTVRTESGSPAAGVRVHLFSREMLGDGLPVEAMTRSFGTRDDGTFRADNLRPGVWSVSASDDAGGKVEEEVKLAAGDPREVELQFGAANRLTVSVMNPQGQPVAQTRVSVRPANDGPLEVGSTDVSGQVVLSVEAGWAEVEATHPRWRTATQEAMLGPGANELSIHLEPGFQITGQVRTVDGRGIQGALVDAGRDYGGEQDSDMPARMMAYGRLAGTTPRTFSDVAGAFRLTGIDPGAWRLGATLPGHAMADEPPRVEVAGQSVTGVVIELAPEAAIRGVVTDLDATDRAASRMATVEVSAWRGTHLQTTSPDVHGTFELDGLSPGEWRMVATSEGRRTPVQTVRVAAGAGNEFVELRFEPGFRLSGQVFSAGAPLTGGDVLLRLSDDSPRRRARTDQQGRFIFEGLPAGTVRLRAYDQNGGGGERELDLQSDVDQLILHVIPTDDLP